MYEGSHPIIVSGHCFRCEFYCYWTIYFIGLPCVRFTKWDNLQGWFRLYNWLCVLFLVLWVNHLPLYDGRISPKSSLKDIWSVNYVNVIACICVIWNLINSFNADSNTKVRNILTTMLCFQVFFSLRCTRNREASANPLNWVQLTIFQHWFRKWLVVDQVTSHYLKQWS